MSDSTNKLKKDPLRKGLDAFMDGAKDLVDHNRYLVAALLVSTLMVGCSMLPAYDRKAIDPVTGELATADEIAASAQERAATLQERYDANATQILVLGESQRALVRDGAELDEDVNAALDQIAEEAQGFGELLGSIGNTVNTLLPGSESVTGPIVTLASVLIAGGAGLDNRRKDRKIRELKA